VLILERIEINVNNKIIYLVRTLPEEDECRKIILEVIKQAVRDYQNLANTKDTKEKEIFEETIDFLFDDEYYFFWGDKEIKLKDLLEIIGIDLIYFREKILELSNDL
jgi:hypothetical protein